MKAIPLKNTMGLVGIVGKEEAKFGTAGDGYRTRTRI
jgi:hypothetical protein